jgi:uncharacterized phage infection (PIP) family protein YhgE
MSALVAAEIVHGGVDDNWHQLFALLRTVNTRLKDVDTRLDVMTSKLGELAQRVEELTDEVRWEDGEGDTDDEDESDISWVASDHTSEPDLTSSVESETTSLSDSSDSEMTVVAD